MSYGQDVISDQPGQKDKREWMPRPIINSCPPGLEYLSQIDQVVVKQVVELFEAFTDIDTKNRYVLTNSLGQQMYYAYEESSLCMRLCCSQYRSFIIHIVDNAGQEVIRVHRPFQLCAGCSVCIKGDNCCAYRIAVESPPGTPVGYFHQSFSWWKPRFILQDATHTDIFKMDGPCCPCQCCCGCTGDLNFRFQGMDGEYIGTVAKIWSGLVKEMFTKADTFSLTFPKDLDVKLKATMIGAMFLIDFMFFEYEDHSNDS
ncbi:Phospholipid scramblase 2 [Holothuria leucospilota]|uniref:Phospholipid scramblase n=1 Tax=Holothuria leucospilota TaxID=206669 RepID=A0A9Q1BDJ7_HOLLE|nr:Phospholipid scramblase 2 [Holothuria leucospilota]